MESCSKCLFAGCRHRASCGIVRAIRHSLPLRISWKEYIFAEEFMVRRPCLEKILMGKPGCTAGAVSLVISFESHDNLRRYYRHLPLALEIQMLRIRGKLSIASH